jgi:hypothetical protein
VSNDAEKPEAEGAPPAAKNKKKKLFGRMHPLHHVLGGGKGIIIMKTGR